MKNYIEINKIAYDHSAAEYSNRIVEYQDSDKLLIEPFIEYIKYNFQKPHVLELGPGSGLALKLLEEEGIRTTAVDISPNIIEVAQITSPQTFFINDNFLSYSFDNQKFDGIFAKAFIHLFPKNDAVQSLNKCHNLLRDDGALFLATTIHEEPSEGLEQKADYDEKPVRFRKKWTENELKEALRDKWNIIDQNHNEERGKMWLALTLTKKAS